MPRYFFNFEGQSSAAAGAGAGADLVGRDLPDDERAKAVGAKLAADLAIDEAVEGELPAYDWLEVLDECQRPVARLRVAETIREPNRRV